jgi:hypothetical protein
MIVDIPPEIQMAIRLRGVKAGLTTGAVVEEAIKLAYASTVAQAKKVLKEREAR